MSAVEVDVAISLSLYLLRAKPVILSNGTLVNGDLLSKDTNA